MSNNIILKVCLGEDIHRITVSSLITYEDLVQKIQKHCSVVVDSFYWVDSEGDKIAICNGVDLEELMHFLSSANLNTIKINVNSSVSKSEGSVVSNNPPTYPSIESKEPKDDFERALKEVDDEDLDEDDEDEDVENDENLPQEIAGQFIHPRAYAKLIKKSMKVKKRQEKLAFCLAKLQSLPKFNLKEYERKADQLKQFGLESNLQMKIIVACQVIRPNCFSKDFKHPKKADQEIINKLKEMQKLDLPHGPRVAKILCLQKKFEFVPSLYSEEVLDLARKFDNLGLPMALVCKILLKKHFKKAHKLPYEGQGFGFGFGHHHRACHAQGHRGHGHRGHGHHGRMHHGVPCAFQTPGVPHFGAPHFGAPFPIHVELKKLNV